MQSLNLSQNDPADALQRAGAARMRSALYGFLALAYRTEPTADTLRHIKATDLGEALALKVDAGGEEALAEELAVEYTALFLGPGGHVSPHESVHIETDGRLLGAACVSVKKYVEASGFDYAEDGTVLPDHISVELDYMAEVTRQEGEAWRNEQWDRVENCLEYEKEFSAQHLRRWVPGFCTAVLDRAALPYYRQVVEITRDFLAEEEDEIEQLLTTIKSV